MRAVWQDMTKLIDDDVFSTLAVRATPAQCAAETVRRFSGCDRICAYFPGYVASDVLIAEFVVAVREPSREGSATPFLKESNT